MEEDTAPKLDLLTSILVIIFNCLQLLNQFINRRGRFVFNLTSFYFMNTALSNLIIGIALLFFASITEETRATGNITILYFHDVIVRFSITIKSLEIGLIATIRFIAARKIESYRKIDRTTLIKITILIWMTALALVFVPFHLFEISMDESHQHFFTLFSACIILPSACLSLILYTRTVFIIYSQSRHHSLHSYYCNSEKCRNLSTAKQKVNKPFKKIDEHFVSSNDNNNQHKTFKDQSFVKRFQKIFETRTVKLVGLMIAMYTVCWAPIALYCILKPNKVEKSLKDDQIADLLIVLGLVYNILTPIICMIHLKSFTKRTPTQNDQQTPKV